MREFENAHKRYHAERERFDAYSLWEVIQRLKGKSPRYDDGFKVLVLEREKLRNEGVCEKMVRQISELKSRLQSYKDRLRNVLSRQESKMGESEMKKMHPAFETRMMWKGRAGLLMNVAIDDGCAYGRSMD